MKKVGLILSIVCLVLVQAFCISPKDSAIKQLAKTVDTSAYSKAIEKLSADQIVEVLKNANHEQASKDDVFFSTTIGSGDSKGNSVIMEIIPFIMVIAIILIVFGVKAYNTRQRTKLAMLCIEKGQQIPNDIFYDKKKVKKSNLNRGIVFISLGLALLIAIYILVGLKWAAISIIPLFLGIGYVVIHFLENNNTNSHTIE